MRKIPFSLLLWIGAPYLHAAGGIATDGTTGPALSLSGAGVTISQSLGRTVGANLFHSFSRFNVDAGQSVSFAGSDTLQNVISRVTGGEASNIDGLLKSEIGHADFYLINPAGVTFGPNAQVDVPAAFHVGTADVLKFKDGATFPASTAASDLSGAAPAAFGFLGTSKANNGLIEANGALLALREGQTLDWVSGTIGIENARLETPSGEIRLAAVRGASEIGLDRTVDGALPLPTVSPSKANAGDILLRLSKINASGDGGGRLAIWGETGQFEAGIIATDNIGAEDANASKGLHIATRELKLDNFRIVFDAQGIGQAGQISVEIAESLKISNGGAIRSNALASGDAGDVSVRTRGNLLLANGSAISSDAYGAGNAGKVLVESGGNIAVDSGSGRFVSYIGSNAWEKSAGQTGHVRATTAGTLLLERFGQIGIDNDATAPDPSALTPTSLNVDALDIVMRNGLIRSSSAGNANAGNISIRFAERMILIGDNGGTSAISSESTVGRGGAIDIVGRGTLLLQDSAIVTSAKAGNARGGDIRIQTNALVMDSGLIQANADGGSGGNILIDAPTLVTGGNLLTVGGAVRIAWTPGTFGLNVIQAASKARADGAVVSSAPQLNLSGVLANFGRPDFDLAAIPQDRCRSDEGSSLVRPGKGGLPPKSGPELPR